MHFGTKPSGLTIKGGLKIEGCKIEGLLYGGYIIYVFSSSRPEVWFSIRMLKTLQMMEIPILKSWIHHLVMDGLTQALVDPGKVDIKVEVVGPTNLASKARAKSNGRGIVIQLRIFFYRKRLS